MSDRSRGQGWWLASDGKWYPPESLPQSPSGELGVADLGQRFLARLTDGVLLSVVFFAIIVPIVVVAVFSESFGSGGAFGGGFRGGSFVASIVAAAGGVGYFALMESSGGQTVGKMMMRLKTEGPDGENPSLEIAPP